MLRAAKYPSRNILRYVLFDWNAPRPVETASAWIPRVPFRGERPMSRREYARRSTVSAQLRQLLNAAAVIATCAAAAFVGAAV
jgi:hypothetical protein